jgi:fatty acid desaturase
VQSYYVKLIFSNRKGGIFMEEIGKKGSDDRNYSFDEIEIDPRFKICESEMKLTFITWAAYAVISISIFYFFGRGDVTQHAYLWGVPIWLALGVWVTTGIFFVIITFIALRVFKDMDISG